MSVDLSAQPLEGHAVCPTLARSVEVVACGLRRPIPAAAYHRATRWSDC